MEGPSIVTGPSTTATTVKFLCRYGGKIVPRYPDGKLRYYGGETRLLAVHRSLSFPDLLVKLGELCGTPVTLRCQLPTEDLDALVSITCDDDLANFFEEYDRAPTVQSPSNCKIRAFLSFLKKTSPVVTASVCAYAALEMPSSPRSPLTLKSRRKLPFRYDKSAGYLLRYACENASQSYLVHSGNHRQLQS